MWRGMMVGCILSTMVAAESVEAQRMISVGLGGGVSVPQGDLHQGANTGWNALGTIVLSTPMQPLGLRADVAYNQFAFNGNQAGFGDGYQTVGSATANVTYRLPTPGTPASPYLIAGLGAYRTDCGGGPECDSSTDFGWDAGLGMKMYFLGFRSFLEARYHRTAQEHTVLNYFPVTFGLMF